MPTKASYPMTIPYSDYTYILTVLFECKKHIEKSHHIDGCQKARENWKECTCGKDSILSNIDDAIRLTQIDED